MNRIRTVSRFPSMAQNLAPEVKLTYLRDFLSLTGEDTMVENLLTATIPLFINKDPSNPVS